ncbi:MAG: glycoside hydrolase family 3 protein [Planctomycetota bacterium]|jgi:beta-N-acetylhexosaminidase
MSGSGEKLLSSLSLRERIAQMIIPKIEGIPQAGDGEYTKLLSLSGGFSFGGYIVFRGAVGTTKQRIDALSEKSGIPPLIMSDLERGPGQQIEGTPLLPHAMAFAATGDTDLAYLAGELTAKTAYENGIQMVLAPVLDVQTNPKNPIIGIRAYSDDPGMVAEFAYRFAHGLVLGGALPTLKHFPGHGDTEADSHAELPVVNPDPDKIGDVELLPYRRILRHFRNAIMVAHIAVDSIAEEPGIPATCSRNVVGELLHNTLDFDGLVITDALLMEGFYDKLGFDEALRRTILAGCDLLLYPADPVETLDKIESFVKDGIIPEKRIEHSAGKILAWKKEIGLIGGRGNGVFEAGIEPEPEDLARTVLEQAVTLITDNESLVPLADVSNLLVAVVDEDGPAKKSAPEPGTALADVLGEAVENTDSLYFGPDSSGEEIESLLGVAQNYETAVVPVFARPRAWKEGGVLTERSAAVLAELIRLVERTVVIIFGTPHIFPMCEGATAVMCMYDTSETAEEAAANALLGRIPIKGRLPVEISQSIKRGSGIERVITQL